MSEQGTFTGMPEPIVPPLSAPMAASALRVARADRAQIEWREVALDSLLPPGHPARAIWDFLQRLDLTAFYGEVRATWNGPGATPTDPQVLLALWLYATADGVGSARRLDRLCQEHDAYRWLRGGVRINYHMLADFRVAHQEALDGLLTEIIGTLMAAGAVTLKRVAQDGMRVRASAGAASFRRRTRLERCLEEAKAQVERLAQEREHPDPGVTKREWAARERAVREHQERVEKALDLLPLAQAAKKRQEQNLAKPRRAKVTEPRVSTTDPEARVMKMPDGGFRPALNLELATDQAKGIIVGVAVTNEGTDAGQAPPMEEQVVRRTGKHPGDYLIDGGFATREAIMVLEQRQVTVYAPVWLRRNRPEEERYQARHGDSPEVAWWRERMATEEGKRVYRQRGASAEWANAQVHQHGITHFTVRGVAKATTVALLVAVTHNLLRWAALGI